MIHSNIQTPSSIQPQVGKPLSYNDIVAYLDGQWQQKFVDTSKASNSDNRDVVDTRRPDRLE